MASPFGLLSCRASNDNPPALRFYQKRGFALVAVHANAVERSRQIKPEIPLIGRGGIPIRDEIELELRTAALDAQKDIALSTDRDPA